MKKYSSSDKTSYILGISLTIEAIRHIPDQMEKVYLSSRCIRNKQYEELIRLCDSENIEVIEDDKVMDLLSVKDNCYGIGVFKKFSNPLTTDRHIVLSGFNDHGELGTIMRSAVAFDFKDLVLIDCLIDYFDPRVVRASMGAIFHLNITSYNSLDEYLAKFKHELYPFTGDGRRGLESVTFKKPYSLLIPQSYHQLDGKFKNALSIEHEGDEISLSALSSIVFNYCYHQNVSDTNISDKGQN